jgi:hypothetical protein
MQYNCGAYKMNLCNCPQPSVAFNRGNLRYNFDISTDYREE